MVRVLVVPPLGPTRFLSINNKIQNMALEAVIGSPTIGEIDLPSQGVGVAFDETAGDRDNPKKNPRAMKLYDALHETSWADSEDLLGTWVFYGLDGKGRPADVPGAVIKLLDDVPGPTHAETSLGYLPITVVRGGIKYPTPKGTTMARQTKAQIKAELQKNLELAAVLDRERIRLREDLKKAIPAEPPTSTMFRVSVKFAMHGKSYDFLILRSGKAYYTTGIKPETARFASWEALIDWLEGPEVYSHTDIELLKSADKVVSFDTGKIQDADYRQPPF